MAGEVRFACGLAPRALKSAVEVRLAVRGAKANIALRVEELLAKLGAPIPPRLADLLEIAGYVAAADSHVSRGDADGRDVGAAWRRRMHLRVAVRDIEFWRAAQVADALRETLAFVSDDHVTFAFERMRRLPSEPSFHRIVSAEEAFRVDRVVAFSGGLDSYAGAVESALGDAKRVALFTLRTGGNKLGPTQELLARSVERAVLERGLQGKVFQFPLAFSRQGDDLDVERSQRTRSFVIAAAGSAVAQCLGVDALHFYENGIVSVNLPISAQLIGTRASRTTHPRTLELLSRLLTLVMARPFRVENPFLFCTKADVVRVIARHGLSEEIARTVSCGDTVHMTTASPHCGMCSQCIDRRLGVIAADCEADDPPSIYRNDVLLASRTGTDLAGAEGYYRRARDIRALDERGFYAQYGEATRAISPLPGRTAENARRLFDLHRRHAAEVLGALDHAGRTLSSVAPSSRSILGLFLATEPRSLTRETRRATRRNVVTVLHVSDTHFSRQKLGQDMVLEALSRDVRTLRDTERVDPDIVIFSGDISDRGTADEFARAEKWLGDALLPAAGLSPEYLVVVPGNHDVDRNEVDPLIRDLRTKILKVKDGQQDLLRDAYMRPRQRALLFAPLERFIEFARRVEPRRSTSDAPWTRAHIRVRDHTIAIAGLSTACFSHDDEDPRRLMVGLHQVLEILPDAQADLTIGVFHHPLSFLAEFDEREVATLLRSRCALLLQGHRHEQDAVLEHRPDIDVITLAAGAGFSAIDYPNRYHVIEWDFDTRTVRIRSRHWDRARWSTDHNAFGGKAAKTGFAELPMPSRSLG